MHYSKPCKHLWTDLAEIPIKGGERYLQQQCDYCKIIRYLPVGKKPNQNGSDAKHKKDPANA